MNSLKTVVMILMILALWLAGKGVCSVDENSQQIFDGAASPSCSAIPPSCSAIPPSCSVDAADSQQILEEVEEETSFAAIPMIPTQSSTSIEVFTSFLVIGIHFLCVIKAALGAVTVLRAVVRLLYNLHPDARYDG